MSREFGTGEQQITLRLDQSGVEPYYTVFLIGRPAKPTGLPYMKVQFGQEEPTERSFLKGKLDDKTPVIALYGLNLAPVPRLDKEATEKEAEVQPIGALRESAIERITFAKGVADPLTLETGSLGEPLAAMRECVSDLVRHLRLGEGPNPELSKDPEPETNPGTWLNSNDYPRSMMRQHKEGMVRFRLTVDSQGKPTSCHITRSTRPQVFDDVVCLALLQRAKFKPALNNQGKPVAAYWSSAVNFSMH